MKLRDFFVSIGSSPSAWCKEHGITPESVLMYLSGKRSSIGLVTAIKIYKATRGMVPVDSLVLPEIAGALAELISFKYASPHPGQGHPDPAQGGSESQPQTLDLPLLD
jgi:hypothetical protein